MRRTGKAVIAFALLILASSAIAQTQPQATLGGVFEPDTADLNNSMAQALKSVDANIKKGHQSSDSKCFPPARTEFKTYSKMTADPAFYDALSHARMLALTAAMTQMGLNPDEFSVDAAPGNDGDVQVSLDTADKQAPILKVSSVPAKGTKVKAGDKIVVTINASERYEDGHKSRPSGVQMIQLIGNPGDLVDSKQFGRPPDPCAKQKAVITFAVPDHPPPVVHLVALAEDAVGNQGSESADFPTAGDWYGTLKAHGQGNIYNDTAEVSFNFSEDTDGSLKGSGHLKVTNAPQSLPNGCIYSWSRAPNEMDFNIGGRRVGDEFHIEFLGSEGWVTASTLTADCPHLGHKVRPPQQFGITGGISVHTEASFFRPRVTARDGATNGYDVTRAGFHETGSIEIHRAKK
jgi:hypothetical protein